MKLKIKNMTGRHLVFHGLNFMIMHKVKKMNGLDVVEEVILEEKEAVDFNNLMNDPKKGKFIKGLIAKGELTVKEIVEKEEKKEEEKKK